MTTLEIRPRLLALAPLPLRLVLGVAFLLHGYVKLFTGEGGDAFAGALSGMGVPLSGVATFLVGGFQFFGGILLILGVGVRVVSAVGVIGMVVAAVVAYPRAGFDFVNVTAMTTDGPAPVGMPGYEVHLLYLAGFASLVISGAGALALPSTRRGSKPQPVESPQPGAEGPPSRT